MKKLLGKLLSLFIAITSISCGQNSQNEISVEALAEEMKTNKNLIILDVRTPPELTGPLGHIDGVINIPLQRLDQKMKELEKYKGNDIAIICRTGRRSGIATNILTKKGFKVRNVVGGMTAYNRIDK